MDQRELNHPALVVSGGASEPTRPFLVGKERLRIEVVGNYDLQRPERQLAIELR